MRFKPRAVFMAVMPLGATILSEHGCTLFSQNIQTVPILSFIKFWFLATYRPDLKNWGSVTGIRTSNLAILWYIF